MDPPACDVVAVIEDAYCEARSLLAARHVEHARLVGRLLHFGNLRRGEIEKQFGDRRFIRALGLFGRDFL